MNPIVAASQQRNQQSGPYQDLASANFGNGANVVMDLLLSLAHPSAKLPQLSSIGIVMSDHYTFSPHPGNA